MNKIGLITFHDTNNFGSLVQTYGLYKKINDLGYDCEVIDYQCENLVKREIPKPLKFSLNPKTFLKDIIYGSKVRCKYKNLNHSLHSMMKLSPRCDRNSVSKLKDSYDKFVVGSDIVWGMDIIAGDTSYFLDFVDDKTKKTAFSSSIGNQWSESDKQIIKPLLADFNYVAVREDESADWVEELTDKRPATVCDPTMLLTADQWGKMTHLRKDAGKYVLVYFDNKNGDCIKSAKEYAKAYGLKVYNINSNRSVNGYTSVMPTTLEDFLSLIYNAAFVVTASYHGLLFSTYFNKQFAYFNRAHKSRMNTLARKLQVSDRDGECMSPVSMPVIDYKTVNKAVDEYRMFSINCLKELLQSK